MNRKRVAGLFALIAATAFAYAAHRYAVAAAISWWPILIEQTLIAAVITVIWAVFVLVPGWGPLGRRMPLLLYALAVFGFWSAASFLRAAPEARRFTAELSRLLGDEQTVRTIGKDSASLAGKMRPALRALHAATDSLAMLSDAYRAATERCRTGDWLLPERIARRAQVVRDRACCDILLDLGMRTMSYYPRYRTQLAHALGLLRGPHRHLARAATAGLEPAVNQAEELFASNLEVARQYRAVFDALLAHWGGFHATAAGMAFTSAAAESAIARPLAELSTRLERHDALAARARLLESAMSRGVVAPR